MFPIKPLAGALSALSVFALSGLPAGATTPVSGGLNAVANSTINSSQTPRSTAVQLLICKIFHGAQFRRCFRRAYLRRRTTALTSLPPPGPRWRPGLPQRRRRYLHGLRLDLFGPRYDYHFFDRQLSRWTRRGRLDLYFHSDPERQDRLGLQFRFLRRQRSFRLAGLGCRFYRLRLRVSCAGRRRSDPVRSLHWNPRCRPNLHHWSKWKTKRLYNWRWRRPFRLYGRQLHLGDHWKRPRAINLGDAAVWLRRTRHHGISAVEEGSYRSLISSVRRSHERPPREAVFSLEAGVRSGRRRRRLAAVQVQGENLLRLPDASERMAAERLETSVAVHRRRTRERRESSARAAPFPASGRLPRRR